MRIDELVDRLVPFNLTLDRDLRIVRAGPGFRATVGTELPGTRLLDWFVARRPADADEHRLEELAGSMLLLESRDGRVRVRGQLIDRGDDGFLLAATPSLEASADLEAGPQPFLAAPHEGWADAYFQASVLEQQRLDLERLVAELEERSARLKAVIDSAVDAIVTIDETGRIEQVNPAGERLFGYAPGELVGKDVALLMTGADATAHGRFVGRYLETGERRVIGLGREVVARRADGSTFDAELALSEFHVGGQPRFTGILRDVTERRSAERLISRQADELRYANAALEAARIEAEAASEAKSLILANVSHEIRTPMNAVLGMTGLLLGSGLTPHQREYAETIRSSSEALLTVIGDLLDFSRIEAARFVLDDTPYEPRVVVEDVLGMLQPRALDKDLRLIGVVATDVPHMVQGDASRLRQILVNLVDNAIKFTAAGEVVVRVSRTDGRFTCSVADTGPGIEPKVRERLFRMFEQGDRSTTRRHGGTGLGLALSRRLAEAMGGTLEVESAPGAGSTFSVTLPLVEVATPPWLPLSGVAVALAVPHPIVREGCENMVRFLGGTLRSEQPDVILVDDGGETVGRAEALPATTTVVGIVDEGRDGPSDPSRRWLHRPLRRQVLVAAVAELFGRAMPAAGASDTPSESLAASPAHILVAEDNPVSQRVVRLQLERSGHHVDTVADGREVLDAVASRQYDILFLDCQMPGLDGYETARAIRRRESRRGERRLPIVALTANALPEERFRCAAAGMDDYLWKPVSERDLAAMVQRWTAGPSLAGLAGDVRDAAGGDPSGGPAQRPGGSSSGAPA